MGLFDNNENVLARIMAAKEGREPTQEEINAHNKLQNDAINTASGVLGRISPVAQEEAPLMSMADKIKQAARKSSVQGPEGGLTNNASMYQQGTQSEAAINSERMAPVYEKFKKLGEMLNK